MKKSVKTLGIVVVLAGAAWAGFHFWQNAQPQKTVIEYTTSDAEIRDLCRSITSTGTVEPEELVNVGAQIGGMIESFGKDTDGNQVDFRSPVKAGQVLAKIDDSLYKAEVDIARAQLQQAKAQLNSATATQTQMNAKYELAKANWDRSQTLYQRGIMAKSEYDSALAEHATASAAKAIADAAVEESKAQILSSTAGLQKCERNLGYCTIASPVDGIIIDRRVNLGQTVNASMNAPSLFLIAKDLKRMQVWVSVNEADIGELKPGQRVTFTVDAFDKRTFEGTVKKVRLNATMSQNVVTYVVEIDTDNSDGTLLPYLTANVKIILAERKQVLSVPNAAFRFQPEGVPAVQAQPGESVVWVKQGENIVPATVKTGLNDGSRTEILSGLNPGDKVVLSSKVSMQKKEVMAGAPPADGDKSGDSPFMPKPPKHNNKGSKAAGEGGPK